MSLAANEFFLIVSMSDFMRWHSEDDDLCEPAPTLLSALSAAAINVEVSELYSRYFDKTLLGYGDVYRYLGSTSSGSLFAINLYREVTDQLDLISFGLQCEPEKSAIVAKYLHTFFTEASFQITFEQKSCNSQWRQLIDATRYPLVVGDSGYSQQLITVASK